MGIPDVCEKRPIGRVAETVSVGQVKLEQPKRSSPHRSPARSAQGYGQAVSTTAQDAGVGR